MHSVSIQGLSFLYQGSDTLILKDINMNVKEGQFVCILGQSGCGKSTLLRLLAGLEKPTTGDIRINDQLIYGAGLDRGVVFQDYGLFPWMTAGENIVFTLEQRFPKKKKKELKELALSLLQEVDLSSDVYDKLPRELSGGMKQRCAIAKAFSLDPPILLMDEPLGALDAVTRSRLQDMVLSLWAKDNIKKTVFFVTHDVDEAVLLANEVYVLGQVPSNIIYQYTFDEDNPPSRKRQFDNAEASKLRNELVEIINKDVEAKKG